MSLPKGHLATRKVQLSGGEVEVRALTLTQSRIASDLDGVERIIASIVFATGTDKPEVEAWLDTAPAGDATALLNAIVEVSGLAAQEAQFPK